MNADQTVTHTNSIEAFKISKGYDNIGSEIFFSKMRSCYEGNKEKFFNWMFVNSQSAIE